MPVVNPAADKRRRDRKLGKLKSKKHARKRYSERFDEPITPEEQRECLKQVRDGKALAVKDGDRECRKIYLVRVGNQWRKCVFDWELGTIVTFLPNGHSR